MYVPGAYRNQKKEWNQVSYELAGGCWELKLGLLQEHQELLTTEPLLQTYGKL